MGQENSYVKIQSNLGTQICRASSADTQQKMVREPKPMRQRRRRSSPIMWEAKNGKKGVRDLPFREAELGQWEQAMEALAVSNLGALINVEGSRRGAATRVSS